MVTQLKVTSSMREVLFEQELSGREEAYVNEAEYGDQRLDSLHIEDDAIEGAKFSSCVTETSYPGKGRLHKTVDFTMTLQNDSERFYLPEGAKVEAGDKKYTARRGIWSKLEVSNRS